MAIESTLALIKPDAFERADDILHIIKQNGFEVAQMEQVWLTKERAGEFYIEHKERPFYDDLTNFMASNPSMVLVLRKEGAIAAWRTLMGPTNAARAKSSHPNSIRALFGTDGSKNAVHGSDSPMSAAREIEFFFPSYSAPTPHTGHNARDYLTKTVSPLLVKALSEMCRLCPANPVEWLGQYLLGVAKDADSAIAADADAAAASALSAKTANGTKKQRIYFVLGGPGSGKGTQCANLVKKFGFDHFSAGDLLRAEVDSGSEQGVMIGEMIKEGTIVPGEITVNLLKKAIQHSSAPGILIDGFPRKLAQAGQFEKDVCDFDFVLFLDCPEEVMEQRLLERGKTSGRSDDNIESIRKRFRTFIETSMPVIEYYDAKGKVRRVDATQPIDSVFNQVQPLFS